MLRTLNSRKKLREQMSSHDLGRTSLHTQQWTHTEADAVESVGTGSCFRFIKMPDSLIRNIYPNQLLLRSFLWQKVYRGRISLKGNARFLLDQLV